MMEHISPHIHSIVWIKRSLIIRSHPDRQGPVGLVEVDDLAEVVVDEDEDEVDNNFLVSPVDFIIII